MSGEKRLMKDREELGFSLLEIIVSLVILSTLAAGIFATVSFAKRVSIQAQQKAIAVSLIQSRLNELKSEGAADLIKEQSVEDLNTITNQLIISGTCPPGKATPYCVSIDEFGGRMKGVVAVKVTPDASDPRFKEVLVTAKWVDFTLPGSSRIRTESAVTAINPE